MRGDDIFEMVVLTFLFGLFLLFCGAIYFAIYRAQVDAECADLGWRDSKVTLFFQPYCINRTDQTDIIKPLAELRK